MATQADPIPGNWYVNRADGSRFRVVGLDEQERSVEIQHQSGDLDDIDMASWYGLDFEPAEPVINPAAPMRDVDEGDVGYTADDPRAARFPSDEERYRRDKVEWASKPGYPDPRPEQADDDRSERGVEQWPESRERPE